MRALLLWTVILLAASASARAAPETDIDLELVLAVDISFSMDPDEQILQRNGYAAAFRHPDVIAAIQAGAYGKIAVIYVEWAGVTTKRVVVPWTIIDGPDAAEAMARAIEASPPKRAFRTSISNALMFSAMQFDDNSFAGMRRVIDVSGDGTNNQGMPVAVTRDDVVGRGVTINGLPILIKRPGSANGYFDIENLDEYYRDCVIGGFGAFLIPVRSRDEFAVAIRRKLVQEIAGADPGMRDAQLLPAAMRQAQQDTTMDCLIGEKVWQRWMEREGAF